MRESVSLRIAAMVSVLVSAACSMPSEESQAPRSQGSGGRSGSGGSSAAGGASAGGGSSATGGSAGSGGKTASGGSSLTGGAGGGSGGRGGAGGDSSGSGGANGGFGGSAAEAGGTTSAGGSSAMGGRARGGTGGSTGGTGTGGGTSRSGGAGGGGSGGATSTGTTTPTGDCPITISISAVSTAIATVGIVEWSTTLSGLASAKIVYTLNNAGASVLNKGGEAPVDLKKANYRTLLLGLKPSSTYTFYVEATTSSGTTCRSADKTLTTGTLSGAPSVTRTAANASAQAVGFIVTSTGQSGGGGGGSNSRAYIIDADGTVVWSAAAPTQCSRAHMDFEGNNLWMLALNVGNSNGEMRFVSMDGLTSKNNVSGLAAAHHDFTVVPGKIAAMVWATTGARDPESNLVEMAADGSGSATTVFKIGSNLYSSSSFHCNHIVYHASEDTFTISDRNPNMVVKVKHDGTPIWQIGGSCTGAPAPKCASGTWKVNHGQDFDGNGNMLLFNNGQSGSTHIFEFKLTETTNAISYTTVKDFTSSYSSNVMGDVQFLPNGNVLITYSSGGTILEVDSSWATVQTLRSTVGYAEWRQTLYGPPARK